MTLKTYKIKSPAKINIGLYVKNKRPDGYHNIETIFYPITLNDEVKIIIRRINGGENIITVKTNSRFDIEGKKNICYRAAEMFLKKFKIQGKYRIDIIIRKRIPIGAGLGGGSSNAAAVLKILSKHFRLKNDGKLSKLASGLGSDVPFFLLGKPAFAGSRGEKLTLLPKFKINYDILLVNPDIQISTKWAYEKLDFKNQFDTGDAKSKNKDRRLIRKSGSANVYVLQNDFEKVVFEKYPEIRKLKEKLYEMGAAFSLMSGSGSTIYGFYEMNSARPAKYLRSRGYRVFLSKCNPHIK